MNHSNISVVIPTWRRTEQLLVTIERLLCCDPLPGEILIQVDAGDHDTEALVKSTFSRRISVETNQTQLGPGGSRNILINRSKFPIVATFDDDSYPLENDFFGWTQSVFSERPTLGAIGFRVFLRNEPITPSQHIYRNARSFENAAAAVRRDAFLGTRGFLPLRFAYGMEESDIAIQLMDQNWEVIFTDARRAFHDTLLAHHESADVIAAHISNTFLLGFLRFPKRYWPLAAIQTLNRVFYSLKVGRWKGITMGLLQIPKKCSQFRNERSEVKASTVRRLRKMQ